MLISQPEVHHFSASLERSHAESDSPIWKWIYERAFPDFASMTDHRDNGYWQGQGIDRSITLNSGKQILVDEKVRLPRPDGRVFTDILLEYLSDENKGKPGWVCKPLMADYIAYYNKPIKKCYLLPVIQMQQAWILHKDKWEKEYDFVIKAPNEDHGYRWTTLSRGIPVDVLFKAIGDCLRIDTSEFSNPNP